MLKCRRIASRVKLVCHPCVLFPEMTLFYIWKKITFSKLKDVHAVNWTVHFTALVSISANYNTFTFTFEAPQNYSTSIREFC